MMYSRFITHTKLQLILGLVGMVWFNGCTTTTTVSPSPGPDYPSYPSTVIPSLPPSYSPSSSQPLCHQVQSGENLYRIALRYGRTYEEVANWNGLRPSRQTADLKPVYDLKPGQKLRVSPGEGTCY